ncbi:hypothetical protein R3P38DRAFT_3081508 [Favolaschia claudopus]|uniref:Uncharacterized protein n=1 Tax=Favolaschia claudopus TaxID=2862362 RepID=A0AAV9ZV73_9AGAR
MHRQGGLPSGGFIILLGESRRVSQYATVMDFLTERREESVFIPPTVSSPPSAEEVQEMITDFLAPLRESMKSVVIGEKDFTLWAPQEPAGAFPEFYANLKIPCDRDMKSDMLLHELGQFNSGDPEFDARLDAVFEPGVLVHKSVINTSGSGKSKLMIEGLSRNWGVYFTAKQDHFRHGSGDLQNVIDETVPQAIGFVQHLDEENINFARHLKTNQDIARAHSLCLLLARLSIFALFLEIVDAIPRDRREMDSIYQTRWLKLQIQPSLLGASVDVFWDLTEHLIDKFAKHTVTHRHLTGPLSQKLGDITRCVAATNPPNDFLFLVVDEVQHAAQQHTTAFRSEPRAASSSSEPKPGKAKLDEDAQNPKTSATKKVAEPRPVLRELLKAWVKHRVVIVAAGTGVDAEVLVETMVSAVNKVRPYQLTSDTGLFGGRDQVVDSESIQERFIRRFIPTELQGQPKYECLIDRIKYWLKGRFRFTTGFISELLARGFRNPHETLNEYIFKFTLPPELDSWTAAERSQWEKVGMVVTDCPPEFVDNDPALRKKIRRKLSERITFEFSKLQSKPAHLALIARMCTDYWVTPYADPNVSEWSQEFVQWGFARFLPDTTPQNMSSARIDEPLVMLALAQWLSRPSFHRSIHDSLVEGINKHDTDGYNGLERYLAYCISGLFSDESGTRFLKDIFSFKSDIHPDWASQRATLVSCWRPDATSDDWVEAKVDWNARPGYHLSSKIDAQDTMDWLEGGSRAPICFPDQLMGPDLLFRLRLDNGQKICVAIQCKHEGAQKLKSDKLRKGMKSTDPKQYFKADEAKHKQALDALRRLPDPVMDAGLGQHTVLRVLASFPGDAAIDRNRREKTLNNISDEMASLDMDYLAKITVNMMPFGFLRDKRKGFKRLHSKMEGSEAPEEEVLRSSKRIKVDLKRVDADSDVEMAGWEIGDAMEM